MGKSTEPLKTRQYVTAETLTYRQCPRSCSVTCKWLCIRCLTEIRVEVFTTLKMPKALIINGIRAARPGGSKPPHSLRVRPKLAQKRWSRDTPSDLCESERPNVGDVNSPWGEVTLVTEGNETVSPFARTEIDRGDSHGLFLCERRDSNPYARRHQILSLAWLPITTRSQNPSEDS